MERWDSTALFGSYARTILPIYQAPPQGLHHNTLSRWCLIVWISRSKCSARSLHIASCAISYFSWICTEANRSACVTSIVNKYTGALVRLLCHQDGDIEVAHSHAGYEKDIGMACAPMIVARMRDWATRKISRILVCLMHQLSFTSSTGRQSFDIFHSWQIGTSCKYHPAHHHSSRVKIPRRKWKWIIVIRTTNYKQPFANDPPQHQAWYCRTFHSHEPRALQGLSISFFEGDIGGEKSDSRLATS